MSRMYHYATVSEALNELNEKGFTIDFNLHEEDIKKNPHQYVIEHVYRYEGDTDPGDEAVVYGIETSSGQKGVFVAGFAANSENDAARILNELSVKN
ncbi:MAG: hypothetical protein ABWZ56_06050 [Flavobacterium sp.]